MDNDIQKHLKRLLPTLTVALGLWSLYILIDSILPFMKDLGLNLLGAVSPFIIALLVAFLIDPIVNIFEKKLRMPRSIAVILALLLVLGVFLVVVILVSSRLIIELIQLSGFLPTLYNYVIQEGWQIIKDVRTFISSNPLPPEVYQSVQDNLTQILDFSKEFIANATEVLVGFLATLPLVFTILIVASIATFFMSKDKEKIINFFINLIPVKMLLPLNKIALNISSALIGFVRAQFFLIMMTAIQATIGLYLLGIEYALTFGVLIGLVDLIPILGPGSVFIPWAFWHILLGKYKFGIALLILYAILTIVRQLLEPKIIGNSIGLHPLATLMAIFIGLRLAGILGIVLGPFVLLILKAFWQLKTT